MSVRWNDGLLGDVINRLIPALDEIDMRIEARAKAELRPGHGKRTGTLQRSIHSTPARRQGNQVVGAVGVEKLTYAYWVHEGTPAHIIQATRGKALRFVVNGAVIFRRSVQHPGTRGIPYLIIGFQHVKPQALGIIAKHMRRGA